MRLSNFSGKSEFVVQALILAGIYILAFACRLFSVLRYESIIHEFDPWFNFRATRFLVSEGFDEFIDWFDDKTWYPLGRWIGNTLYPGLMWTAAVGYKILHSLNLPVDIRDVCVFLAPFMASNTALVTYFLTKECWTSSAGVVAAAFVALTPGYISRSVAGSYDNEAVAIFAMLLTFYLWVKAVHTGSAFWSGLCALGYFYMVAAWGGYIFITNIIPCHVLAIILFGKMNSKVYVAYSIWYPLGTLLSMTIGFVSFIPVSSPEHAGAFGVFCLLQVWLLYTYLQGILHKSQFQYVIYLAVMTIFAGIVIIGLLAYSGTIPFLTGRLKSLLGSTSNIAIVKSVSEHQPTAWGTFFLDMHFCLIYAVPGLYYCFHYLTNENLFLILYLLFASYFSSIMVRLMLVIAPIVCIVGGIGMSEFILTFCQSYLTSTPDSPEESTSTEPKETPTSKSGKDSKKAKEAKVSKKKASTSKLSKNPFFSSSFPDIDSSEIESVRDSARKEVVKDTNFVVTAAVLLLLTFFSFLYVVHCTWVSSVAHSSPNIILSADMGDGSRKIFDDYREAYQWLRHNTDENAKIMSWWDYGYQITGMGNRTTIVDNNTRNNSHIATVGTAMSSREPRAYEIMQYLDVDYVLVVFGGMIGYSGDDINKFLWMVRIGGGVFPEIKERDYFTKHGHYSVGKDASETMLNSLMYSLCYYRFGELQTHPGQPAGFDRMRQYEIGRKNFELEHLEEAFTTEHWMLRIYRVKKPANRIKFQ